MVYFYTFNMETYVQIKLQNWNIKKLQIKKTS